jgi:hypothetical protein
MECEASVLTKLNHPLIIHPCGQIGDGKDSNAGLVMEIGGNGRLTTFVERSKQDISLHFTETKIGKILIGLFLGCAFCIRSGFSIVT